MAGDATDERDASFARFDRAIAEAMGIRNAADARLVALVQECLAEEWWQVQGTQSPAHWCRVRLGIGAPAAAKLVRCAAGLGEYPCVAGAFAAGQLSIDHVDLIVTEVNPRYDRSVAESAPLWDIARMRRIVRNFAFPKESLDAPERSQPAARVGAGWGDEGVYRSSLTLGAELGALWEKAMGLARDRLFADRTGVAADDDDRDTEPTLVSPIDALARLLHAALDGLDPAVAAGRRPSDRTQVIVHVDAEHPERARLHLGPLLPTTVARELICDADLRMALRRHSKVVALGRRRRTVDQLLRLVVEERDGGCRVDGCDRRHFLHVHHLVHWVDGGPTSPDNLVCLCPEHHRLVHAGLLRLVGDPTRPDGLVTVDARGRPLPRPGPVAPARPLSPASDYAGTLWGERLRLRDPDSSFR